MQIQKKTVFGRFYILKIKLSVLSVEGNLRMTRLTNAFSKKAENHAHMMAIYFMHYNFVRIHQTLKITPAMAAGVTPKLWEMSDMVKILEDWEQSVSCRQALCSAVNNDHN
jgi:hypothetical protein